MVTGRSPVVMMRSIVKSFLDVKANDHIDFDLFPGEICALLGENGAGKTTLMNILFGYYASDGGDIVIKGERVFPSAPKDAIARGIGMIQQHFALVPSQSVLENILIGTGKGLFLDLKPARQKLLHLQDRFGLHVDPDAKVWTLSVGEAQKVEILKALFKDVDILIMDEPTAVLAPSETVDLFKTLRMLVQEGRSVVFISHKLNEVMAVSDRVVVLRNGRVVAEKKTAETTPRELANLMVGRDVLERIEKRDIPAGRPVLEIRNLHALNDKKLTALEAVTLTVRQHEVVGLAGISGNGQRELVEVLFGMRRPVEGEVRVLGASLRMGHPESAVRLGMGRIPEDRMGTGLILDLTVEENLVLETHGTQGFSRWGLLNTGRIRRFGEDIINRYGIKTAGADAITKSLSGGNLQKVMVARELAGQPAAVIASQPTRGLDVGAMEYIHQRLLQERERGAAVLLLSEDLDEIFALSDRILVIYEGKLMGESPAQEASREQIGLWMTGVAK